MSDIGTALKLVAAIVGALCVSGCEPETKAKNTQAEKAAAAANAIQFIDNAEIDNIKARVELTSKPGLLGFVLLMNEAGQPILYESVKGKITSGGKRLTSPDRYVPSGPNGFIRQAASDEGTWGHSGEYIFYWTQSGEYRQWNGKYLYSDKPFRLRVEPLVVSVAATAAAK